MRIAVIYESMYGNTAAIAEAIAEGLRTHAEVTVTPAGERITTDADMLVIGAPTHAHGMPTTGTRTTVDKQVEDAAAEGAPLDLSPTGAIRELLGAIIDGSGTSAASFDTRFDKPAWLTGSAAKGIAKRLTKHGYRMVAEPESFFVSGAEGPLAPGEIERAREWGAGLLASVGS